MDERLANIEKQKQTALNESKNVFQGLINDSQNLYKQQQNYANQQEQIQNNMIDQRWQLTKQQIDKQKNEATQNFQDERKRAKNDYTSFINPYGVNAEHQASQGLNNSGYSETTKLGGFNTYQNRLARANQTMQKAIDDYNMSMNEARTNYDTQKGQLALEKLKLQLGFSQDLYNNKANLTQQQLTNNQSLNSDYFNRYQTVYGNIQAEKDREEQIRQYNEKFGYQKERDKVSDQQYNDKFAYQKERDSIADRQYNEKFAYQKERDKVSDNQYNQTFNYQKERDKIGDSQWQQQYALSRQKANSSGYSGIPIDYLKEGDGTSSNEPEITQNVSEIPKEEVKQEKKEEPKKEEKKFKWSDLFMVLNRK